VSTVKIPIKDIVRSSEIQPRVELDHRAIEDYAENVDSLPPIRVVKVDGTPYVADGFHRVEGYAKAGKHAIPCEVVEGTMRDAVLIATSANKRHGVRLKLADRRRALEMLLRDPECAKWSNYRLAEHTGCSHVLAANVRAELVKAGVIKEEEYTIGRDGVARKLARQDDRETLAVDPGDDGEDRGEESEEGREGVTVVDGVEQDDPPEVAARREAGVIPRDAVVTRTSGRDAPEPEEKPLSDHDYLESLPLNQFLGEVPLEHYHRYALAYKWLREARRKFQDEFRATCRRFGNDNGVGDSLYEIQTSRWLRTPGPEDLKLCPPTELGGCGGQGTVLRERCPKCGGRGFTLYKPRND